MLGTVRRLGLDKALPKGPGRRAKLILAMIVARIIEPAAKLATARQLSEATAAHSLGAVLGLGEVDEDELYAALDLLGRSQTGVEKVLAQRHLEDGVLVLYNVTSSYLEGRRCELAQFGYSRDHRRDRPQIVFGLLCTPEGCPVAVEVFEGNLGDPSTLSNQVRRPSAARRSQPSRRARSQRRQVVSHCSPNTRAVDQRVAMGGGAGLRGRAPVHDHRRSRERHLRRLRAASAHGLKPLEETPRASPRSQVRCSAMTPIDWADLRVAQRDA